MRERSYSDFDLLVEGSSEGGYRARVIHSPVGETGSVAIELPFTEQDIELFLLRIGRPRLAVRGGARANLMPTIEDFGAKLFDAVFRDEIRVALAASLSSAESDDAGLRIRLRLADAPELADLPWEFIYDRSAGRFLALSDWTPLVRYLELQTRIRPLSVTPPLRILVMAASPVDFDVLDSAGEKARLNEALADLVAANRVVVEAESTGTLAGLQRKLRLGEYHVFHFIGHGAFDETEDDGVLYFEGPARHSQAVTAQAIGELLHDHRSLRLAVLNACEGARSGRVDPFAGTAQTLVRQGIPAVVAMQFEITDDAALTFAHSMYEAVADGYPLDASMAEARKSVKSMPNPVEWATPVLYMRAEDGRVFALEPNLPYEHQENAPVQAPEVDRATGKPLEAAIAAGGAAEQNPDPLPDSNEPIRRPPNAVHPREDDAGLLQEDESLQKESGALPVSMAAPLPESVPTPAPEPVSAGGPAPTISGAAAPPIGAAPARADDPASVSRGRRWPVIASIVAALVVVGGLVWGVAALWGGLPSGDRQASPASTPSPTPQATPSPTTYPAVQLAIPAAVDWTMTGVSCAEGDVLSITATGTILHTLDADAVVGPDGLLTPEGVPDPIFLQYNVPGVPDVATASLIGSLDKQEPFAVGSNLTYTCPRAGALFLGINDMGLYGNSGAWDVTIVETDNPPLN